MKPNPVQYSVFCDYASISSDGKLNLNGIFEQIFANSVPARHPQMYLVTKFRLPKGDHKIAITLMQQDKVLAKSSIEKNVEKESDSHTHLWSIANVNFESWDPIEVQVLMSGKQIYSNQLNLVELKKKAE
jgi:hypothetical protein